MQCLRTSCNAMFNHQRLQIGTVSHQAVKLCNMYQDN